MEHTSQAIESAELEDSLDSFDEMVRFGVSANLCDSVAELAKQGRGIEISINWARDRQHDVVDGSFPFTMNSAQILSAAAQSFRRKVPSYGELVIGHVVRLARDIDEFDGKATLSAVRNDRPIQLNVEFEKSAFEAVIRAFQQRDPISVEGDIHREGNSYHLLNPRNLSLATI